ncbi:extracellular solute-binding protein [Anaerobranca gottschalkii]|uniref:Maltodextrin-binding protein n=1 Tax=Anaerobranca gottschalkii DSM 13577 TaxID=1120990 RepID=A0A1H9ZQR7_9FIRM|nr:extracellular solute-binding protein [Anaerobranca gottschalkii]SES84001.1 arabinogalactan oligomer / maltooligosaccharide transport system substrate-binding protein [Anaerobranca gottschalkii DSM 13577]
MRKFGLVSLVMLLVMGLLAGCVSRPSDNGGGETVIPDKPEKLVIWESDEWVKNVEKIAKKFTEKYGIEVEVVGVSELEQRDTLKLDGPAGLGADVVTWPHDQIGEAVMAGIIIPIDEWIEEGTLEQFYEGAIMAMHYDGYLYGLPKTIETTALIYNKDIISNPPQTWEELWSVVKEHTNKNDNRFGFLFDFKNFYFVHGFFAGMGGYVFGFEDGVYDIDDIGLNNQGAVAALELIKEFTDGGYLPLSTDYDVMQDQFNLGRTPMIINGPWSIQGFKDAGINVGVAPLPTLPNGNNPMPFSGYKGWYLSAFSEHPYWATKLIEFLSNKESSELRFTDTNQIPPRHDITFNDEIAAAFLAQGEFAIPMPNIPEMRVVWGNVSDAIDLATRGEMGSQEALDQAVKFIRDGIAEMHE